MAWDDWDPTKEQYVDWLIRHHGETAPYQTGAPGSPGDSSSPMPYIPSIPVTAAPADPAADQPLPQAAPVDKPPTRDFAADVRRLYPWIPAPLVAVFADAWAKYGDPELALAEVRQSPNYETFFPGNRRDDGSFRLSEPEHLAVMEGYRQRWKAYGAPADVIEARLPDLIRNGVSPDEFGSNLDRVYVGVVTNSANVRRFYAENYGAGDLSDSALFASAVVADVDPLVIERRIRSAQIGGEAADKGFSRTGADVERLAGYGLDQEAARRLYGEAAKQLPTLNELIDRFNDPDDELTLDEFENAFVVNDPQQMAQIGRLLSQAQSAFSPRSLFRTSQTGEVAGLRQR